MAQRGVFAQALEPALACVLIVHAAASLPAQGKGDDSDQSEEVYDLGPGVVPPRIIKQAAPHPSSARGVKVVGSVTIALVVNSKGMPRDVHVVKGLDKDVDQNAIEAVEQWRFAPAQKDRKPVAVRITLEIAFHEM
jgi:periplasmic protein TonB